MDRRGRFREVFCAVLEAHGRSLPDYRPCDDALVEAVLRFVEEDLDSE